VVVDDDDESALDFALELQPATNQTRTVVDAAIVISHLRETIKRPPDRGMWARANAGAKRYVQR
jgi:hypothetical protein